MKEEELMKEEKLAMFGSLIQKRLDNKSIKDALSAIQNNTNEEQNKNNQ